MIRHTMFVLAVHDLEKSAVFYRDVLGFGIHEIGDPGWRLLARDGCRIMIGECPDALSADELGDHSYFAYLEVDDAGTYYERAQKQGADLIKPLTDEPWGMREFGLRTIDGHRIMVGQDLDDVE